MAQTFLPYLANVVKEFLTLTDASGRYVQKVALALRNGSDEPSDITIGQQTKANSVPIAIASDQDALPISTSNLAVNATAAAVGVIWTQDSTKYRGVAIQIYGTFVGTVVFEASNDLGTYSSIIGYNEANANSAPVSSATAPGMFIFPIGAISVRVRVSAYTSGTIGAHANFTQDTLASMVTGGTFAVTTLGTVTPGTAATSLGKAEDAVAVSADVGVFVLGVRRDLLVSSVSANGDYTEQAGTKYSSQLVKQEQYHARSFTSEMLITAPAAATDIAELFGNATTTVVVTGVELYGTATAATALEFTLIRRSTANTAGTSTNGTVINHDSADTANVSVPKQYTANPTTGTLLGTVRQAFVLLDIAAGATVRNVIAWVFGETQSAKGIVLNGTAQGVAINLNGTTPAGASLRVRISWIELP